LKEPTQDCRELMIFMGSAEARQQPSRADAHGVKELSQEIQSFQCPMIGVVISASAEMTPQNPDAVDTIGKCPDNAVGLHARGALHWDHPEIERQLDPVLSRSIGPY